MVNEAYKQDPKQRTLEMFGDQLAATYDTLRAASDAVAPLVDTAKFRPGDRVLDVCTGTGAVALLAASAVGPAGSVVGTDLSTSMIDEAAKKAASLGTTNVEFAVGDAEDLEFGDASFDTVTCGLGIFFLPNQQQALAEWHRVLKPGGKVYFSAFAKGTALPQARMLRELLGEFGLDQPSVVVSMLPTPEDCRRVLEEAGFSDIATDAYNLSFYHQTPEEYWAEAKGHGTAAPFFSLSPENQIAFREKHLDAVVELTTPEGILWKSVLTVASGRRT